MVSEDHFIGETFSTPSGGVLTVLSVCPKSSNVKIYNLSCSICSEDIELFPELFKSRKGCLVRGQIPCGCSKVTKWTKKQYQVRVSRSCTERGYKFLGFSGNKVMHSTKLKLKCNADDNEWSTTSLNDFFHSETGCPVCGKLKAANSITKPVEVMTGSFMLSGKFLDGTVFTRNVHNNGDRRCWDVYCPKCSNDEYVVSGLCSGVFTARTTHLRRGKRPCRCSHAYCWTKDQREYKLFKVMEDEGLKFKGWGDGYINSRSKFNWLCLFRHKCSTTFGNFIGKNSRCGTCEKIRKKENGIGYGYYPHRKDEKDFLYILNFDSLYIKVGRSFDVDKRITKLVTYSGVSKVNIKILKLYTETHQVVYDTEQWLHQELAAMGFYHTGSTWSIETFHTDCIGYLESLLLQSGVSTKLQDSYKSTKD